ncbi:MAG: 2-phospho-L-lactate transferase [Polyangiaceae bacterium]|nr:2-phospho-L-lactate transferase [Polyangiaceae bacterium]
MRDSRFVYLSGGVGGARLARGLCDVLPPSNLSLVVNTGDDFLHWGLFISPDLDTVMYSVSGVGHEARGWGLEEETFHAVSAMDRLEEHFPQEATTWFQLGDRDLATHLVRTQALASGAPLTRVTAKLFESFGVRHQVLPMSDQPQPTFIHTRANDGEPAQRLTFQDWLVRRRAKDPVAKVELGGSGEATPEVLRAIEQADCVLIAPSNPYVSIDPILRLSGVRERIEKKPCLAVSPIIGGRAVKGPLAEMLSDLEGLTPSPHAVMLHYAGLVNGCVVEASDLEQQPRCDVSWFPGATLMGTRADSRRLAECVVKCAQELLEER